MSDFLVVPVLRFCPLFWRIWRGDWKGFVRGTLLQSVAVHTRTAVNWRSGIHYLPPIFAQSLSKCPERESPTHSSTILHFFHVDVDKTTSHLSASPMLRPPTPNPRPPSPWPSVRLVFRQRKSHSLHEPCYCCCCCLGDRSGRAVVLDVSDVSVAREQNI